jgi:hypothetical protein
MIQATLTATAKSPPGQLTRRSSSAKRISESL